MSVTSKLGEVKIDILPNDSVATANTYEVSILLNGVETVAEIDSGASHCLIHPSLIPSLGTSVFPTDFPVELGHSQATASTSGVTAEISCSLGPCRTSFQFYVMPIRAKCLFIHLHT